MLRITIRKGMRSLTLEDVEAGDTYADVLERTEVATMFPLGDNDELLDSENQVVDRDDDIENGDVISITQRANTKA